MYHFIGIKGSGMSALAQIMKKLGYEVNGSDVEDYFFTQIELDKLGIKITSFAEKNINKGQIIVRGTTFKDDNIEVKTAKKLGLKIYDYPEMLGELTQMFKTICVTGCHGKTTTTGLLSHIINKTLGCNYLIGDGTGDANKKNDLFVIESCEYQQHFLKYYPSYTIITNIDFDHVDYYHGINEIISTFQELVDKTKTKVIACGDDKNILKLHSDKIVYYGFEKNNDVQARNLKLTNNGSSFDVYLKNKLFGHFDLTIFGKHMVLNALAVIYLCQLLGLTKEEINDHFKTFNGVKRRFTEYFVNDNVIIDDYAHHPNEVKSMINAVKQKYHDKKIITVFQPHTFSRTKAFYQDFVEEFKNVDECYFTQIYKSREKSEDYPDINIEMITSQLTNSKIITLNDYKLFKEYHNSVILIMSPNELKSLVDGIVEVMER